MEYCFNIDNNIINTVDNENFTFLSECDFNYRVFYDMLNSYEEFKLKNIYGFIYIRISKLNEIYGIGLLTKKPINKKMSFIEFNMLLKKYIEKDIIKTIIVLNSIQQYYCPLIDI